MIHQVLFCTNPSLAHSGFFLGYFFLSFTGLVADVLNFTFGLTTGCIVFVCIPLNELHICVILIQIDLIPVSTLYV